MKKTSKIYHILEERDGEYFDRVSCATYEEAEEIVQQVKGNFLIVPASEVDDYLDFTNENDDSFK